jgi:hypothetical protein
MNSDEALTEALTFDGGELVLGCGARIFSVEAAVFKTPILPPTKGTRLSSPHPESYHTNVVGGAGGNNCGGCDKDSRDLDRNDYGDDYTGAVADGSESDCLYIDGNDNGQGH